MANSGGLRLGHVIRAAGYSLKGLRAAFQEENAFRVELVLFVILAPLGIWLGTDGVERALLVGSLILVLVVELINSGIEAVVDRISSEHHPLSGRAKDVGAAAVLVAIVNTIVVWLLVVT